MAKMGLASRITTAVALCASVLSANACARLHAKAIGPALEAPAPPPRVVPEAVQPIASQPIVAPPVGEVQAATPPPERIPAVTSKAPDAPPPAPPAVVPPPAAPAPAPTLQTTVNSAAGEQRTRTALANATRDLGRIDIRTLGVDARAQYDIARRFVAQATDALTAKNYEFAEQLADKAATLAALLQR